MRISDWSSDVCSSDLAALFTHKGLSGPAILQVSSHWRHGQPISIDFFPSMESGWLIACKRARPRGTMRSVLAAHLPDRLAGTTAERLGLAGELANFSDRRDRKDVV